MEILGHKKKLVDIQKEVLQGTGGRSFLFTGPRAIGKFRGAMLLAQDIVGEPNFLATAEAPYPADIFVLEPGTELKDEKVKAKGITVEAIREAIQFLSRYPSKGAYRVVIIRDAHVLAPAGQNMLLKTLEEPVGSALLILVTHEPGALLETVRSRLSEKIFFPVAADELTQAYPEEWLLEHGIPVFFRGFGRPGVLEAASAHPEQFLQKKEFLSQLYKITQLTVKERLTLAEELAKDVPAAIEILEWWLTGLRGQVIRQEKQGQKVQFYTFLKNIFEVIETLKTTQTNARLLLEQLFFQIR